MKTISPHELNSLVKSGETPILIDVRTPTEFQEVHIDFAKNIPLDKLNPQEFISESSDRDKPIYLICKSGSRGKMACDKLSKAGFQNAINVDGGTESCLDTELPVTRGKKVMSLERQVRVAAGALIVIGVSLGFLVHPGFFGLSGFIGAGLVFAGLTDTCAMGMLIAKMPWNQIKSCSANPASENASSPKQSSPKQSSGNQLVTQRGME